MDGKKTRVALLYGGKSAEREVSCLSATNVFQAMDRDRYDVFLVAIDQNGRWIARDDFKQSEIDRGPLVVPKGGRQFALLPGMEGEAVLIDSSTSAIAGATKIDVVFPVLHGRTAKTEQFKAPLSW